MPARGVQNAPLQDGDLGIQLCQIGVQRVQGVALLLNYLQLLLVEHLVLSAQLFAQVGETDVWLDSFNGCDHKLHNRGC